MTFDEGSECLKDMKTFRFSNEIYNIIQHGYKRDPLHDKQLLEQINIDQKIIFRFQLHTICYPIQKQTLGFQFHKIPNPIKVQTLA